MFPHVIPIFTLIACCLQQNEILRVCMRLLNLVFRFLYYFVFSIAELQLFALDTK